jgi:hypothetical protein
MKTEISHLDGGELIDFPQFSPPDEVNYLLTKGSISGIFRFAFHPFGKEDGL